MERLRRYRLLTLAGGVLLAAGALMPVRAQDSDDMQRSVARISLMNGEVSVQRGDSGDWVAGIINAPLLAGDRIATGPNSRAEIQLDAANILRIGGNALVQLTALEYGQYQIQLAHGTVTYDVIRPSSVNAEVDTPSVAVKPANEGIYRIYVNDAGESQVTVRSGRVEVYGPSGSQWVQNGQTLLARGDASSPEFQMAGAIPYDDWDGWNADRDRALTRATSYQYVPQGVYGVEDLDPYGSWANVEPYGYCWHPTMVDASWAPYRMGRWVWEDWYGWTWVSYDPWGWAPYHYGRWFWNAGGWWWYPGVIGRRHYWSPALVAFFGYGGGVGVGFGFGNVGWVPLAPYETFRPWWGRGYYGNRTYINQNIQITNVNITNTYRNARVNGISGMAAGDFTGGRFHNIRSVQATQIHEAGLVQGRMPLGPTNNNLRFSDRNVARVPAVRTTNTRFFSHQQISQVQRVPFAEQQRAFNPGAGTPGREQNSGAPNWRRFGNAAPAGSIQPPPQRTPAANTSPANPVNRGGWQRFGTPGREPNQQPAPAARPEPSGNPGVGRYNGSRFATPSGGQQQPLRVSPPVVRQRESAPVQAAPRYQAPRPQAPRYEAPRQPSAPRSYSPPPARSAAPRGNGGGGGGNHSGGESRGRR